MSQSLSQELRSSVDGQVTLMMDSGYRSDAEIIDSTAELFIDEADESSLRSYVTEVVQRSSREHAAKAASWPAVTDCDRLDRAFSNLESRGIVARQDFTCCQTCGHAEIDDQMEAAKDRGVRVRGYTFFHQQDTETAAQGGGIYLAYGSVEPTDAAMLAVAKDVAEEVSRQGLRVTWDERLDHRILVSLDWKRRRPPE